MGLRRWSKMYWWRARRHLYGRRPPYAFRIGSGHDRFELRFYKPVYAFRHLATRSGRRNLRMGLDLHRLQCVRAGGYSPAYFAGLDRWRRATGGQT